jgi:hypothetical protein
MKIFKKVGGGFKWLGKKTLWVFRRKETKLALKLAASMVPIPAFNMILMLVMLIEQEDMAGTEKMAIALKALPEILKEYGVEIKDESDMKLLIELAVLIMKRG